MRAKPAFLHADNPFCSLPQRRDAGGGRACMPTEWNGRHKPEPKPARRGRPIEAGHGGQARRPIQKRLLAVIGALQRPADGPRACGRPRHLPARGERPRSRRRPRRQTPAAQAGVPAAGPSRAARQVRLEPRPSPSQQSLRKRRSWRAPVTSHAVARGPSSARRRLLGPRRDPSRAACPSSMVRPRTGLTLTKSTPASRARVLRACARRAAPRPPELICVFFQRQPAERDDQLPCAL